MKQKATQRLIAQLQRAEPAALQEVYTQCKDHCLYKLQTYEKCSLEDAEDLFTDAVLILRQNVLTGKVQQIKKLREYVYTICLNQKRVQYQRLQQASRAEVEVRQRFYDSSVENEVEKLTDDPAYWEALATAAFEQLSEKCQAVIQSYYYEGLPMETIAQQLGMASANVAKVTKCRCYKQWMKNVEAIQERNE